MKVGRNEPCHCGSGKKFKQCHDKKDTGKINQLFLIGFLSLGFILLMFFSSSNSVDHSISANKSPQPFNFQGNKLTQKPEGKAPPGKIWSAEHGHWHDSPTSVLESKRNSSIEKHNDGKVWNADHGHYHEE